MKTITTHHLHRAVMAAAIAGAFGPAMAQQAEPALTSEVSAGVGYVDKDNQKFGEFSGLRKEDPYLLLGGDLVRRDDATGTWLRLRGRNLGLDSRSLRFEHERQGDWGYFIEYDAIPRFAPYTYNTGLAGIGTTTQTIGPTATLAAINAAQKSNVELSTKRENISAGFGKLLGRGFDFQVRFRNEEKDGSRAYGLYATQGGIGIGGPHFLAEPINWTTRQWEATLGYTSDRFQFTGGYYGSTYDNPNPRLNVLGADVTFGTAPTQAPGFMALPPSNQAHQLHAAGGYSFTPATRGTFKVAYSRATQDEAFGIATVGGQTSLDGQVDTTLLQVGLSTRPMPKLSLLADLRYEDRDDKTARGQYISTPSTTRSGFNNPRSLRSIKGKLEASYLLPAGIRLTGGAERDERERSVPALRSVPFREDTADTTYRVELRRSISETLNGAVALVHDERTGSSPARDTYAAGTAGSNVVMPVHWNDRKRDKVRLTLDWMATQRLSAHAVIEDGKDKYSSFDTFLEGLHNADSRFYSLDGSYAISDAWQVSAWVSRTEIKSHQVTESGGRWAAGLTTLGDSYGVGLRAKPMARLQLGADVVHSYDRDKFDMSRVGAGTAVTSLPSLYYRLTSLKFFAKYAFERNSGVQLDFIHDRRSTDDWTWNNWTYPDGTRVIQNPSEKVNFVGVRYYYQFR